MMRSRLIFLVFLGLFGLVNWLFEIEVRPRRDLFGFKGQSPKIAGVAVSDVNLTPEEEEKAAHAYIKFKKLKRTTIPSGIPKVYGGVLGISFDKVQDGINKLRVFGPTYGKEGEKIELEGEDLERFIKIGKQTACEYCCGVDALVKDDGSAACGCAHSIAMRGLAAYLIKNHSDKFSDDEILAEINEWKKAFFPKQTLSTKFDELKKSGDEDIEALLQEFPDFLPQMVGGC